LLHRVRRTPQSCSNNLWTRAIEIETLSQYLPRGICRSSAQLALNLTNATHLIERFSARPMRFRFPSPRPLIAPLPVELRLLSRKWPECASELNRSR
jgi:hypothetical protein